MQGIKLGLDPGVWKLDSSRKSSPINSPSDTSSDINANIEQQPSTVKK